MKDSETVNVFAQRFCEEQAGSTPALIEAKLHDWLCVHSRVHYSVFICAIKTFYHHVN